MTSSEGGASAGGYDLVIKGGRVFDSANRTFSRQDVAVRDGKIARMAPTIEPTGAKQVVDASGRIVTPGLIDSHMHGYPLGNLTGLDVDPLSSRSGVTTFVDAGTTGVMNFLAFRKYVIDKARSNLFAMLNVSAIGQAMEGMAGLKIDEYDDLRVLHIASAVEQIEGNRDIVVGIKVRMYQGLTSLMPLAAGRELAQEVGLPMAVHVESPPPTFRDILPYLRPGDIITHVYHPAPGAVVDRNGRLKPEYKEAKERGVVIDSGSARLYNCFPIVRAALEQGFAPDTISTDLTTVTVNNLTIDLPNTLSKFLALGLSLEDTLTAVTATAARMLPKDRGIGQLGEGLSADIAVFELEEGEFRYNDFYGNVLTGQRRFVTRATIKDGVVLTPTPTEPLPWSFIRR
ncbi:MAG: amidohydrolase/deacetylase family metallohydrolase [Dehalococcoidales bacterium]|nr:amidohydrolase/deacetylase family metallohydrolase [Dehalococcoidales bacterium]